jgi:hypothetical protein
LKHLNFVVQSHFKKFSVVFFIRPQNLSDVIVSLGSNVTPGIPPSSLTQFIAAINDLESRGVVISDHSAEYVNPFYHSHFDNIHNIDSEIVCSAATLLARSLLLLATNTSFSDLSKFEIQI